MFLPEGEVAEAAGDPMPSPAGASLSGRNVREVAFDLLRYLRSNVDWV